MSRHADVLDDGLVVEAKAIAFGTDIRDQADMEVRLSFRTA
jgi:hypothetical protein